ncbi:MAG: 3D domain-containing protein [Parcubacteria group bacterium]|jgi:3D (Asp-Asp-Asp) domain-containing protein
MDIISIIAALPLLVNVATVPVTEAKETVNTNTKIEVEEQKNISIKEEVKSEQEIKNDKVLAKWKEKQENMWKSLPKEKFTINASAYTAAADECGKSDGITASGIKVGEKRTLACPPSYPFGAKIKIEGVGTLICEDRGGAIKGNHFDIYVETKKEAFAFGRRNLLAEVVE